MHSNHIIDNMITIEIDATNVCSREIGRTNVILLDL